MKLPAGLNSQALVAAVITAAVTALVLAYAQRNSPKLRAWLSTAPPTVSP